MQGGGDRLLVALDVHGVAKALGDVGLVAVGDNVGFELEVEVVEDAGHLGGGICYEVFVANVHKGDGGVAHKVGQGRDVVSGDGVLGVGGAPYHPLGPGQPRS